jgi:hypothetical protein
MSSERESEQEEYPSSTDIEEFKRAHPDDWQDLLWVPEDLWDQ